MEELSLEVAIEILEDDAVLQQMENSEEFKLYADAVAKILEVAKAVKTIQGA